MKEIKLTQGKVALVDDEDFEYLNQFKWVAFRTKYAYYARRKTIINGRTRIISMHRLIINTPNKMMTDHIDHNGLNNQKYNLRICTCGQNAMNRNSYGISKYLGVYFTKRVNKLSEWTCIRADITVNKKTIHLGSFKTEEAAARAYDKAAKQYHGEFANLNFKD